MGHLIVSRVEVLSCVACGRVIQVSPVNPHRVRKLIRTRACCMDADLVWEIRGIVRVWPRLDCEELYYAASLEDDEFQGREVWRFDPLHLEHLGITPRPAASTGEDDATRNWYAR